MRHVDTHLAALVVAMMSVVNRVRSFKMDEPSVGLRLIDDHTFVAVSSSGSTPPPALLPPFLRLISSSSSSSLLAHDVD